MNSNLSSFPFESVRSVGPQSEEAELWRSRCRIPEEIVLWRRLRPGMSTAEVRVIFGDPDQSGGIPEETWLYRRGPSIMDLTLVFRDGLLCKWTEPDPGLYMTGGRRAVLQPS